MADTGPIADTDENQDDIADGRRRIDAPGRAGARLTREEVMRRADQAREAGERLDLSGYDLSGLDLGGSSVVWQDVVFGQHHGPPPAILNRTSFRGSNFDGCFFAHAELTGTDFRDCHLRGCDFRYAALRRATLRNAHLMLCDLYRASIEDGTVMLDTKLELVGLGATLDGARDLRWATFAGTGGRPAIVAESEEDYRAFLERTKEDRPETDPIDKAIEKRLDDAARGYRGLSGLWTAQGQFRDAGLAYAHSRRLERQAAGPRYPGQPFRPLTWMWLWLADLVCGFGESLGRIVLWLAVVALLPGVVYWSFGSVVGAEGFVDDLLFSVSQVTTATPSRLTPGDDVVEWVGVVQTFAGVALLGLFGFVLGNKIRHS